MVWFALDIVFMADSSNIVIFEPYITFDSYNECKLFMEPKRQLLSLLLGVDNVKSFLQTCLEIPYIRSG